MGTNADDTRWMDATAQAELVRTGAATPLELLEAAIERIEAHDGPINSVVMKWYDHAREVAERGAAPDAPFGGVPFLLKDLWASYRGQVLTNGNAALKEAQAVSPSDTTLVSRFRAAGLVTMGRTNSPELGSVPVTEPVAYGPTRNPWDTSRTPGGSSGRGRCRSRPDRARVRRWRFDPDTGLVLWADRLEAVAGPDHDRPGSDRVGFERRVVRQSLGP